MLHRSILRRATIKEDNNTKQVVAQQQHSKEIHYTKCPDAVDLQCFPHSRVLTRESFLTII